MFRYNGKTLKNSEIQDISIIVWLGEEAKSNYWRDNEEYVHKKLVNAKNTVSMDIQCPIEDLVYLNPTFSGIGEIGYYVKTTEDYDLLMDLYKKVSEIFKGKLVQIAIQSELLSDKHNVFPISLEEFIEYYSLDESEENINE